MNFKKLPKIDLHLHLDGAIRVPTIAELGDKLGVTLPTYDPKKLAKFVQVDRDCRSLTDFLKRFEVFYPILPYAITQERIAYELCEDCARDNVIYFETRFAPSLACNEKFTMEDAVLAALEGLRRGQRDFSVRCGLILCCYRSITTQQNIDTVKLARKHRASGVIGIDLAGDELHYPAAPHAEVFALARKLEIPITIHAGEGGKSENIREAVFDHGATRIGHGVALGQDSELLKRVRDRGTVFEICLTSNLQTCSVPSLQTHPFQRFFDEKVRVTLNTDDPAISDITLTDEFELAARAYKLTPAQIRELLVNAAQAAFAEPSVRRELVSRLRI
ncbi:MAG TPA: adenosine deaminase [Verrucomicrobiae bacterium]|nr:adenosine deaminase [Verrucomicrobiae bacterium]